MGNFIKTAFGLFFLACGVIGAALVLKILIIAATGAGCVSIEVLGHEFRAGDQCKEASHE